LKTWLYHLDISGIFPFGMISWCDAALLKTIQYQGYFAAMGQRWS
jgi:hypothetical protein